ncbi:hypothetical protein AVEN_179180-1 [Araneus ventricosus]|uniref:Peptidase aspartic putative domain-containing protein n=1 Tax=Araneus ventricosus TaxID=182803 RepID=A0A4Y2C9B9_ARAVE|nr:hypothetical protein AVEN_179180-1 [Araneus ventricosus]
MKKLLADYLDLPESTNLEESLDVIYTMEKEIEDLQVKFKILLTKHCKGPNADNVPMTVHKPKLKIPDLPLPEFSASLKGDAKLIENTQDTFQSLLSALDTRYENKRAVIDTLIPNLLSLGKVNDSPRQLRNLVDIVKRNLRALENLKLSRNNLTDALLVHILERKIDSESQKLFQMENKSSEILSLDCFLNFIEDRTRILEGINKNCTTTVNSNLNKQFVKPKQNFSPPKALIVNSHNKSKKCVLQNCDEFHPLYRCSKFKSFKLSDRIDCVQRNKLSKKCLSFHRNTNCKSKYNCFMCGDSHNSLLHDDSKINNKNNSCREEEDTPLSASPHSSSTTQVEQTATSFCCSTFLNRKSILLCTARVFIRNKENKFAPVRAILDSASEINIISSDCANFLGLKKEKLFLPVSGICGSTQNASRKVATSLSNLNTNYQ